MKDRKYQEIYITRDYDKFKNVCGNRTIRRNNLEKIMASMQEKQLVIPICVNEKLEIIDGQHRFRACRELELPVYYHIQEGYRLDDIERANRANTNWVISDFLASYVVKGNERYKELQEIINENSISVSETLKILAKFKGSNMKNFTEKLKKEELEITTEDLNNLRTFLECLSIFKDFSGYRSARFTSAFLALYTHPKYNHDMMIQKWTSQKERLKHCFTIEEYLSALANHIYSAKKSHKNNIYFNPQTKHLYS